MKACKLFLVATFGFLAVTISFAQVKKNPDIPKKDSSEIRLNDIKTSQKSTTYGTVTIEGKKINYEAVAGTLVMNNKKGAPVISMSYTAYFKDGEDTNKRPITFIFNGGPGSSTVWLHMGCWGPKRVNIQDMERSKAPYSTISNEFSLLNASDLVFIDAPGTGFGDIITKDLGGEGDAKDYFGIDEDGQAFSDFIAKFITTYNRWNSPKYLFGESYGTFRSAIIANNLLNANISLNGIIMLSQLLSYAHVTETTSSNPGTDLPFMLILPSYAATAYYHKKLPKMPTALEPFLKEVEQFALTDYALALNQGADLDEATFNRIALKLNLYTGLPIDYIKKANLRVKGPQFAQTLLGDNAQITGRLDSRFSADAINPLSENAQYDPMSSFIGSAFTASLNSYMRNELNFGNDMLYKIRGNVYPWNFKRNTYIGFPNVINDLSRTMILNPTMKVLLTGGYYDLGTPYFEGIYEMKHLPIPAALQKNITYEYYPSGHMMYLHPESLKQLHKTVSNFIRETH